MFERVSYSNNSDVDWVAPYVLTKEKVDAFWQEYNAEVAAWQEVIDRMKTRDALVETSSNLSNPGIIFSRQS